MCHKRWFTFIILINCVSVLVFAYEFDYNSVPIDYNESAVIVKSVSAEINYKLTWPDFSPGPAGAQLVVSLPPQLRMRQQLTLPTRIKTEVVDKNISIKIRNVSAIHHGFYSAFRVVTTADGRQYVDERRDFYLNVIGLSKQGDSCYDDSYCQSNTCINNTCLCPEHRPVLIDQNCYTGQPIGQKCIHSNQCRYTAGEDSECSFKTKCRCINNAFVITVPYHGKLCVKPKVLYDRCIFSEQCLAIGSNRYCAPDLTCQCIPGHRYKPGVGCALGSNSFPKTLTSAYFWPLLALAIARTLPLNM